jgi:outer membrane protein OmpA-like peptidoglycan-associated protein
MASNRFSRSRGLGRWHQANRLALCAIFGLSVTGCQVWSGRGSSRLGRLAPIRAPIYTRGPVPIPGRKIKLPYVKGIDGKPIRIAKAPPGSFVTFDRHESRPPEKVFIRKHIADADPLQGEPPIVLDARKIRTGDQDLVGFDVPHLPRGVYDAWYTDGRSNLAKNSPRHPIPPPNPQATQFVTFEVSPELAAETSVVRGEIGQEVEIAVGFKGRTTGQPPSDAMIELAGFNDAVELVSPRKARAKISRDGLARFRVRIVGECDVYLFAYEEGAEPTAIRVVGGSVHPVRDNRLQVGDLLLCQGTSPLVSESIANGEEFEIKTPNPHGRPWYSHVALYIGKNGTETAEMEMTGLKRRSLKETRDDCTTLDVYRYKDIVGNQQQKIVDAVLKYGDTPYAIGQIATLGFLSGLEKVRFERSEHGFWGCLFSCPAETVVIVGLSAALSVSASYASMSDGGKRKMICSEMAAWAYHDAGVEIGVAHWPSMHKNGLLTSGNAQKDYTTPNMISHSKDVSFKFQYWPAKPSPALLSKKRIELTEDIEFDTGSWTIDETSKEVLDEVLLILKQHPEITKLRIEGHTDNVGTPARNQTLSEQRANAVLKWFVSQGIDTGRLESEGFGDTRPLGSNDSDETRKMNRRVEFHIPDNTPSLKK